MTLMETVQHPLVVGPVAAFLGFIGKTIAEWNGRRMELRKVQVEKEPDRDRVWKDGMVDLVRELKAEIASQREDIAASREEQAAQRETIAELRDEVADLNEHIDNLTGVLKAHNITPPPRRRRAATASTEVTG